MVAQDDADAGAFTDMLLPPPGTACGGADLSSGGQVFLVLLGALEHGQSLAALASAALTRDEPALQFDAGTDGLQVLMSKYPRRA